VFDKRNEVLVVLSSAQSLKLYEDILVRTEVSHETGFFLSELMVPLKAIVGAGFVPIFATPLGEPAPLDPASDDPSWFRNAAEYREMRKLGQSLGLEEDGFGTVRKPLALGDIALEDVASLCGVFVPGGHAPMMDLAGETNLGAILRHAHQSGVPTGLICHGPVALLSALESPAEYIQTLKALRIAQADRVGNEAVRLSTTLSYLSQNWVYRDYELTSFSTVEERLEEGRGGSLGGFVPYYVDQALDYAGAVVNVRARPFQSHVIRDRELVTGQNPMSVEVFADTFVKLLTSDRAEWMTHQQKAAAAGDISLSDSNNEEMPDRMRINPSTPSNRIPTPPNKHGLGQGGSLSDL